MTQTSLLFAPLPSISPGDKLHKTERTSAVHAGIMWQRAAKHFLSTASAGVVVQCFLTTWIFHTSQMNLKKKSVQ